MADAPVVEVRGLTVFRGGERVLSEVSWCVRPGEHWVLFGGNGSGKTTLLSALLTYVPAARGSPCGSGVPAGCGPAVAPDDGAAAPGSRARRKSARRSRAMPP